MVVDLPHAVGRGFDSQSPAPVEHKRNCATNNNLDRILSKTNLYYRVNNI